ncbi:MAG: hypothetical protein GF350_04285 [Chitinivibrionales bacterium]|nr:hypothetical protein [Chitinivibrionales bacterium]
MESSKDHSGFLCDFVEMSLAFSEGATVDDFFQKTVAMGAAYMEAQVWWVYLFDPSDNTLTIAREPGPGNFDRAVSATAAHLQKLPSLKAVKQALYNSKHFQPSNRREQTIPRWSGPRCSIHRIV